MSLFVALLFTTTLVASIYALCANDCCKDRDGPCISNPFTIGETESPNNFISLSSLESKLYSVASCSTVFFEKSKIAVINIYGCNSRSPLHTIQIEGLDINKFHTHVLDESYDQKGRLETLLVSRFTSLSKGAGVILTKFKSEDKESDSRVFFDGPAVLYKNVGDLDLPPVDLEVDPELYRFYIITHASPDFQPYAKSSRVLYIQGISLATWNNVPKECSVPFKNFAEYPPCGLETLRKIFVSGESHSPCYVTAMRLCGCTVIAPCADGSVQAFCCHTLHPIPGCLIKPICRRCRPDSVAQVKKVEWCCKERLLLVLYNIGATKSFVRAYQVSLPGSENKKGSCENGPCFKYLYSIKGCRIINTKTCCITCPDGPVTYALIQDPSANYYIRAYIRGHLVAQARLEGNVVNNGMTTGICRPCKTETNSRPQSLSCPCCSCGAYVPVTLDGSSTYIKFICLANLRA